MLRGRPKKRPRTQNISGLRGQHQAPDSSVSHALEDVRSDNMEERDQYFTLVSKFSGVEEGNEWLSDTESEDDEECEWDILESEEFCQKLVEMVQRENDKDRDWIPAWLWSKKQKARKCKFLFYASCRHQEIKGI